MTKPAQHEQEFEFAGPASAVTMRRPGLYGGRWLDLGPLAGLIPQHVEVSRTQCFWNPDREDVCREVLIPGWWSQQRLGQIAEAIHQRLYEPAWRVLAPNLVLHHAFGPGFTIATDGVHVVLFDCPVAPTVWLEVQRANVIGPVTSVPTEVAEWDGTASATRPKGKLAALRQRILDEL